ncbi:MAG TPA: ABC transporter substrate-binding protein, partial [Gammaproteobacteria bacterium]|nr:ABC transporter substrate-binding protein [Gammaproteobacteria bacterium]
TWAIHVNIAPTWFDPAETTGIITPYMFLYAMHDALVKPMPDNPMSPSLATKWSESADGLTYDFELRQGVKFHNGDPFTAEDVQYSFERYKGAGTADLKKKVKAVEIVTPHHIRFQLHEPWPDFLTFYGTPATGAGWIVPKNYTEKIGSEKFKEQPIGLGHYRFVSYQPGVELVLEANTDYWRKTPHVKRLVMKSVPEATTRLAMLKKQEADVTYGLYGALGEEVRNDPNLKLEPVIPPGTQWIVFAEYYHDPKSPWADKRVRQAANYAINRQAINEAETLGYSLLTGSIIPRKFQYALPLEPYGYNPDKAKQLLKEAGYPNGFDAGECSTDTVYAAVVEAAANDLGALDIRLKVRPMERAAVQTTWKEKTVKNLTRMGSGAFGNAATRVEGFIYSKGMNSFIQDPEIDEWFLQQDKELDPKKREALLHKIQQKVYDQAYFIPIWELTFLCASGPRVAVSGLGLIPLFVYSGPYEELQLRS